MNDLSTVLATFLLAVVMMVVVAAIMSLPVMLLWDWLMPSIFGLRTVTWLEAWGIMFLCGLLFKSHTTKSS